MISLTGALLVGASLSGFLLWYRGRKAPLTANEVKAFLDLAVRHGVDVDDPELFAALRRLLETDDGKEFIMVNLIRYRERALYPAGYDFGGTAVDADRRYARALFPRLIRYGNFPIFIARRSGLFIEPPDATPWQLVAMVRYRSKRDFVRSAMAVMGKDVMVHKWAAISVTHVFPVRPLFSLLSVRLLAGALWVAALIAAYLATMPSA